MASLKANIILRGKIECITGLHIGAATEKLEIGGVDSPVIRHPQTRYPYIPGSSLKGKLRSLLEFALGVVDASGLPSKDKRITRIFGTGADAKSIEQGPTRLIVRDCFPDEKTISMWVNQVDSALLYTEYKAENTLNRITSAANPRFIERVVSGSFFDFELIYSAFQVSPEDTNEQFLEDFNHIILAMELLEDNYLGKAGSRGYGKIQFHCAELLTISVDEYLTGKGNFLRYKEKIEPIYSVHDLKRTNLF